MQMSELYLAIKNNEKFSDISQSIEFAVNLWEEYTDFNLSVEKI